MSSPLSAVLLILTIEFLKEQLKNLTSKTSLQSSKFSPLFDRRNEKGTLDPYRKTEKKTDDQILLPEDRIKRKKDD